MDTLPQSQENNSNEELESLKKQLEILRKEQLLLQSQLNKIADSKIVDEGTTKDSRSLKEKFGYSLSPTALILICIMVLGAILRFKGLEIQSLWADEINTMRESSPSTSFPQLFQFLRTADPHPPLIFVLEHFMFLLFGYNEFVARFLPALIGVVSIFTMYLLGKEIRNERTGLIIAALTAVNYFNIHFSQEARAYILVWLFTSLSYLFFIRLCKHLRRKDMVLFTVFTVLLLYSHYYSFFVLASEIVLTIIIGLQEKENKKIFFRTFATATLVMFLAYLPLIPFIQGAGKVNMSWIPKVGPGFFVDYVSYYFGNSKILPVLILGLCVYYLFIVFHNTDRFRKIKSNPNVLSFVFAITTITLCWGIPFLRSVLVAPMLQARYSIIVLPPILIVMACSIDMLREKYTRNGVLAVFLILSVYHLFFIRLFYQYKFKSQFREVTAFIAADKKNYPLINEGTAWHQQYYLDKFNYTGPVLSGKKEDIIDSILQKTSKKYDLDTFWLVRIFYDKPLDSTKQKELDTAYTIIKDSSFFEARAQLYSKKKKDTP